MTSKPDTSKPNAARDYHIPLKGWGEIVKGAVLSIGKDHLSVVSAGCAYYALLAIFPVLTASIALYGLTRDPATVASDFSFLQTVLPAQAYETVIGQIRRIAETSGGTLGWGFAVSLAIALWMANRLAQAMFSALDIAYGLPEQRSIPRYLLSAIGYASIAILGGVVMLFAIVYVPILFDAAGYPHIYKTLVTYLRWPVFLVFTLFLLALVYRFGPSRPSPRWRWVTVGSVFAAFVWLLASLGFSYYVSNFANYDRMYGTLGGVIVLLFWLYLSFYIVLFGAAINAQAERWTEANAGNAGN